MSDDLRLAAGGDMTARARVIEGNLGLVGYVAKGLRWGGMWEDLMSAGTVGLIRAIDRYDPERGESKPGPGAFASYAEPFIRYEIHQWIASERARLSGTRERIRRGYIIRAKAARLRSRLGREPTVAELVEHTRHTEEMVAEAVSSPRSFISLDSGTPAGEDPDRKERHETIDLEASEREDRAADADVERLLPLLHCLPRRHEIVIRQSYGIDCEPMRDEDIAEGLHVARTRVQVLRQQAIEQLREYFLRG